VVKAFAEAVIRAFPAFTYEVLPPICVAADGTLCAVKWRIRGSHVLSLEPLGHAPAADPGYLASVAGRPSTTDPGLVGALQAMMPPDKPMNARGPPLRVVHWSRAASGRDVLLPS